MTQNGKTKNKFTPTQQKMMDLFSDGESHTRQELHGCLYDNHPDASLSNIIAHIRGIRVKIRPAGEDIVCEMVNRKPCYRHTLATEPLET